MRQPKKKIVKKRLKHPTPKVEILTGKRAKEEIAVQDRAAIISGVARILKPVIDAIERTCYTRGADKDRRLDAQAAKIVALENTWKGMPSDAEIVLQGGLDGAVDFLNNRIDALRRSMIEDLTGAEREADEEKLRTLDLLNRTNNEVMGLRRQMEEIQKRFEFVAYPFVSHPPLEMSGGSTAHPPIPGTTW